MSATPLTLEWLPGTYAVCRFERHLPLPALACLNGTVDPAAPLLGILRTENELAVIIAESHIPADAKVRSERGFIAMRIVGTLDFSLVGVLAKLTGALAAAGIPVFVLSTFDTDVILLRERDKPCAVKALSREAIEWKEATA